MTKQHRAFEQSLKRLKEALALRKTILTRDASILRFEFTFELGWKCVQKALRKEAIICQSPKACIQMAVSVHLVEDDERWQQMIEDRNLAVHSYDEKLARAIYRRLSAYVPLFEELSRALQSRK